MPRAYVVDLNEKLDSAYKYKRFSRSGPGKEDGISSLKARCVSLLRSQIMIPSHESNATKYRVYTQRLRALTAAVQDCRSISGAGGAYLATSTRSSKRTNLVHAR